MKKMRRAKIGDVYYIKVPNGYKIFQWAYRVPKIADYIRVFEGLYEDIPTNISEIVEAPHSYIISFHITRAYRIGLAKLLGTYVVPDSYPFPEFQVSFFTDDEGNVFLMDIMRTNGTMDDWTYFYASHMEELPEPYRSITVLNHHVTPNWLLYLFDSNFNLSEPKNFFPGIPGENFADKVQIYTDIVERYLSCYKSANTTKCT